MSVDLSKFTREELEAMLRKSASKGTNVKFAVQGKPNVSVYGLGRFPVTLYREGWRRLIAMIPEIEACLEANKEAIDSAEAEFKANKEAA
jgi:hypothetical protein